MTRRRAILITSGVVAAIAAVAVIATLGARPSAVTVDDVPDGYTARWERLPDSPIGPRTGVNTYLYDGSVLLFGGHEYSGDYVVERYDGALYDPDRNRWTEIDAAPLSPREYPDSWLADGRLVVFGGAASDEYGSEIFGEDEIIDGEVYAMSLDRYDGAVLDLSTGRWTPILDVDGEWRHAPRVVAWDGTELVLFGDRSTGNLRSMSGAVVGLDGSVTDIPEAPIARREYEITAWDGERLLVWGGMLGDRASEGELGPRSNDGAVWERATGEWTIVSEGPIPPTRVAEQEATVDDGRALIVAIPPEDCADCRISDAAWYDLAADTWEPVSYDEVQHLHDRGRRGSAGLGIDLWSGDDPHVVTVADTDGGPRDITTPAAGSLVSPDVLASDFYAGLTISVQVEPNVWLSAPVPGGHRRGAAVAVLPDGDVIVWGGADRKPKRDGWRLRVEEMDP